MNIYDVAKALVLKHEGLKLQLYTDTKGFPTIGVGFFLHRTDAKKRLEAVGANFDAVMKGGKITSVQAMDLLDYDVNNSVVQLLSIFPDLDTMPDNAQICLIDFMFNVGYHTFLEFKNFIYNMKAGDFRKAGDDLQKSLWASQVKTRAVDDIALLDKI